MKTFETVLLIITWCAWMQIQTITAFSPNFIRTNAGNTQVSVQRSRRHTYSYIIKSTKNDFEDLPDDDDSAGEEGKELAKQFYNQLKKREEAAKSQQRPEDADADADALENYNVKSSKKFTGRRGEIDSTGKPSAGLFAGGNGSVYASFPVDGQKPTGTRTRTPYSSSEVLSQRDGMMRDEINFMRVASSETTIIVQGILVLLLLGVTLYIGSTGGITDGSERFGAFDGMINEFNGLGDSIDFSAIVTDDASTTVAADVVKEGSVWL